LPVHGPNDDAAFEAGMPDGSHPEGRQWDESDAPSPVPGMSQRHRQQREERSAAHRPEEETGSAPEAESSPSPPPVTVGYNDIDLSHWKDYGEIETDSLWILPSRARGSGHQLEYHGNFIPQIATQTFLRYSREGEIVLDLFLGCGTSAIEAVRLKRRCFGVELKSELVDYVADRLRGPVKAGDIRLLAADSTREETRERVQSEMQAAWDRAHADLLVLHPPYADIIRFSDDTADLSNKGNTAEFLAAFTQVARNGYELLAPGRFAVVVIGDKYAESELVPLGFYCLQAMNEVGFRTKSIVVKNIEGNEVGKGRTNNLWRYRALKGGFYIFKHEYVLIMQKPR
jgi:16S rRNA G966 N2-methylase RsmD